MYVILGKNGYIAKAIINELESRQLKYLALSRSDVDYTDFKQFSNYAQIHHNSYSKPFKNAIIINCAGYIGKQMLMLVSQIKAIQLWVMLYFLLI